MPPSFCKCIQSGGMRKIWKILLFILLVLFVLVVMLVRQVPIKKPEAYGVTFSAFYAERFSLDWRKAYIALFEDLGVRKIRIPAYWNEIEKVEGIYDFSRLDWQIIEAEKHNAEIILALGRKLPRWPECHEPGWFQNKESEARNQKLLAYIETTVNRYGGNKAIKIWQIENEPFLKFGECEGYSGDFVDKEISLVRSLDPRPIMITDSGELSIWAQAYRRSDVFGSTLYRTIWHPRAGTFTYPLPPSFFRLKRALVELFYTKRPAIIIELQGESWASQMTYEISVKEQYVSMNPQAFRNVLNYAARSGFDTFYLWGVEWWYWLKEVENKPEMWEIAKETIKLTQ